MYVVPVSSMKPPAALTMIRKRQDTKNKKYILVALYIFSNFSNCYTSTYCTSYVAILNDEPYL